MDDSYAVDEDRSLTVAVPGVLANDRDADGSTLTAVLVTGPGRGHLTLNTDGSFVYVPSANFNGTDSFVYRAIDGQGGTDSAIVTITVRAVNDPPAAVNDVGTTSKNNAITLWILANDYDVDGDVLRVGGITQPSSGSVVVNPDQSIMFRPKPGFRGTVQMSYTAHDGRVASPAAYVTIQVMD
jgi:large repetitive protein